MAKTNSLNILHPIDSFGIQKVPLSGIRIEKLEDRIRPGVPFPHKHDFFQVLLLIKGAGDHQIDFVNYKASPEQIYVMKPGQMHSWKFKSGVSGILIEFSYDSLNSMKDSSSLIHTLSLAPDFFSEIKKEEFREIELLAKILLKESNFKRDMYDICLQGELVGFIINLIRLFQRHLKDGKSLSTIEKFREILESNFKKEHGVTFYANELRTSPKALTMQISRAMGKAPRQLIQDRILLEAKRFLAFSDISIAEIGYELGFADANYFTRFFRIHEGKSPAVFRKDCSKTG